MTQQNYITAFCSIHPGSVNVNHSIVFSDKDNSGADFMKAVYRHYQMNYPKFFKMDSLCKLAFVSSELLMKNNVITERYSKGDIAIITGNSSSSLEIDTEHQQTISDKANYFPSPAVFVYTLPNILIGEIAIRNGIQGENTFFIFDKFDAGFMSSYINSLLETDKAQCCIAGWVDFYEGEYRALLYTVEKHSGTLSIPHTEAELEQLITKQLN